jgi:hypothetical protein
MACGCIVLPLPSPGVYEIRQVQFMRRQRFPNQTTQINLEPLAALH